MQFCLQANVSQAEYERAHREYLKKVQQLDGQSSRSTKRLHVFHATGKVAEAEGPLCPVPVHRMVFLSLSIRGLFENSLERKNERTILGSAQSRSRLSEKIYIRARYNYYPCKHLARGVSAEYSKKTDGSRHVY